MKAVVFNLGCKTNRYEADAMMAELAAAGLDVADRLEPADFCIINTCAVTAEAEKKSRQAVARAKKAGIQTVFVCGCASEHHKDAYLAKSGVRYVMGNRGKSQLVADILSGKFACEADAPVNPVSDSNPAVTALKPFSSSSLHQKIDKKRSILQQKNAVAPQQNDHHFDKTLQTAKDVSSEGGRDYEEFVANPQGTRARATLKIQDGCDNFCSYCIIPYLRGRSRSRAKDAVVQEAEQLAMHTKELVLTGINLSQYGADGGATLAELIGALSHIDVRIRLGSFYVEGVTDELLHALNGLKQFCPQFHLSLQSGDDDVLRAMNRKYSTADYLQAVNKIRKVFPTAAITTDIITGYPTETEQNARNTEQFLREVGFSDIHVFVYSKREGTAAAKQKELPDSVKAERKARLLALKAELSHTFLLKNIGVPQSVLIEEKKGAEWVGYSKNYLRVYSDSSDELQTIVATKQYKDGIK